MSDRFFPTRPEVHPKIYAYRLIDIDYKKNLLKIGYTTRFDAKTRIEEQFKTARLQYEIVLEEDAIRSDGSTFMDHEIHSYLIKKGIKRKEWERFLCEVQDVQAAIFAIRHRQENQENRIYDFPMRPEQIAAVEKTMNYFQANKQDSLTTSHFLWNAKMRFGKTFATYQLAKCMGLTKVLILTFKPAVEDAWYKDLMSHQDFVWWQFISKNLWTSYEMLDLTKPFVCFGSFQDYLGKNEVGGVKNTNERVHTTYRDIVVFDEYHYGAWREGAKKLFDDTSEDNEEDKIWIDIFKDWIKEAEKILPITTHHYLYLSGTPFRALSSGEFIEEQIYNRTYSDEQKAKAEWQWSKNPYEALPQMVMMTYQMPDSIKYVAQWGEFDEFDLNVFFRAEWIWEKSTFVYEEYVQKWLDLIRGSFQETTIDDLKLWAKKPAFPFSDARLLSLLTHTFWFLPSVASCFAMKNLLMQRQNIFYQWYRIVVAAGNQAWQWVKALQPVLEAMDDPLKSKTITLSTGKLTTGVSVAPWSGILMLRNLKSPETYFQSAFRVQTPWTIDNPDGKSPNKKEVLKKICYVFDFAPTRALNQLADYSNKLDPKEPNPEKKVSQFIKFLPVLAYDGSSMKEIDAIGILDIVTSGTTATLLARRWESALLVNVDNDTLQRLMANEKAMNALMNIEWFRSLNQDLETIINKSESVKKTKQEANERSLSSKDKKQLTDDEKEYKSKRKEIQQKLIKFATRIPVFMYLTDHREISLKDVIIQLEPLLFKKVTWLNVQDFELLVSLNIFNDILMNDAVFKFKRYEDASLEYTGINKHSGEKVGWYNTVIDDQEYRRL